MTGNSYFKTGLKKRWETRRHNPSSPDWAIVKLGAASGRILGIEIDTAFFFGNEAPAVSVEGTLDSPSVSSEVYYFTMDCLYSSGSQS